jgi:hypothetical protein
MLFNKDYLFIHIPRTAGKCVKSACIPFLDKPLYLAQRHTEPKHFNDNDFTRINKLLVHSSLEELKYLKEINHLENIPQEDILRRPTMFIRNQILPNIDEAKKIIICLRNPLDRAKSLYKFDFFKALTFQNRKDKKFSFPDFDTYLLKLGKTLWRGSIKNFCTINGQIPKNVHFIKFSNLQKDLSDLLNVNNIDIKSRQHNQIKELTDIQKESFFKLKDKEKAIDIINTWEEWAIQRGLLNAVTEKDLSI